MRKVSNKNKTKKAVINQQQCDKSPFCPVKKVCPVNAVIPLGKDEKPKKNIFGFSLPSGYKIDEEKCTGCGLCVRSCPQGAIKLV